MIKMIDLSETYYEAERLLGEQMFDEAEDLLVTVAEQPQVYGTWAGSFINTLVYSILMPQERFQEAIAWLDDAIESDMGYESWNAMSNLGHLMLKLGEVELAKNLFSAIVAAGEGPLEEAEEFLALILEGNASRFRVKKEDPTKHQAYLALYSTMERDGFDEETIKLYSDSRGGCTFGFVNGVMQAEGIEKLRPTRDVVAKALLDYMNSLDVTPSYEDALRAAKSGSWHAGHKRALREKAINGSGEAAYYLSQVLIKEDLDSHAWSQLAQSLGYESPLSEREPTDLSRSSQTKLRRF